jgi:hypothetical protein
MTNNNQDVLDEFDKKFPDPMTEKYGQGFALYCSNCNGQSREQIKAFISQKLTERTKQVIEAIPNSEVSEQPDGIFFRTDLTPIKQQLTSHFLDQEVGGKE